MRWALFLVLFAASAAQAAAPVPYFNRSYGTSQDTGSFNTNFLEITNGRRNALVNTLSNLTCGPTQAIVGASEKQGYIFGGTCASVASVSGSTVSVTSPLSGNGSVANPVALTGAIPTGLLNLSTVPVAGTCTLPNVVTAIGSSLTCQEPSNTTGNSATTSLASAVVSGGVNFSTITTQFNLVAVATTAAAANLTALGVSTTAIAASTTSIYAALNSTASYQTTQNNSIAASTTTLQAEISAVGTSTNVTAAWQVDNFIGQVNGSQKVFTLSLTPSSTAAVECVLDGLTLGTSDYSYTAPTTITVTTAPASNSTGFWCRYTYNTSTAPAVAVLPSTQTFTGFNTFTGTTTLSGPTIANVIDVVAIDSETLGTNQTACPTVISTTPLTALTVNVGGYASLASNLVTLPAGTYKAQWFYTSYSVNPMITALYNTTNGKYLLRGTNQSSTVASGATSAGSGQFTLSVQSAIALQAKCNTGSAAGASSDNVPGLSYEQYSYLEMVRVQ